MTEQNNQPRQKRSGLTSRWRRMSMRSKALTGTAGVVAAALLVSGGAAAYAAWTVTHTVTATIVAQNPGYALSTSSTGTFTDGDIDLSSLISQLGQSADIEIPLYAKNTTSDPSNLDETIAGAPISLTGSLFQGADPATVTWQADPTGTLLPKSGTPVKIGTIVVRTDASWPAATYAAATGSVSVGISIQ